MCTPELRKAGTDCGKCICSHSAQYNSHNYVGTGEHVTLSDKRTGEVIFRKETKKCNKGCDGYE